VSNGINASLKMKKIFKSWRRIVVIVVRDAFPNTKETENDILWTRNYSPYSANEQYREKMHDC
jgi:hypothetical protein